MQLITQKNRSEISCEDRQKITTRQALANLVRKDDVIGQAARKLKAADKITAIVIARVENPRALNRVKHFTPSGEANTSALTTKERPLSSSGEKYTHRRICDRKAIQLSLHEKQEVAGCVREVLLTANWKDGAKIKMHGERIPFSAWKLIFANVRRTLGIQRIMSRMESVEAMEDETFSSKNPDILHPIRRQDIAIALIIDRIENREKALAKREAISRRLAYDHHCLLLAYRASQSRKSLSVFRGFIDFSIIAARASLGLGHGMTTYDIAQKLAKRYREQVAIGEGLMDQASSPSRENYATCDAIVFRTRRDRNTLMNPALV